MWLNWILGKHVLPQTAALPSIVAAIVFIYLFVQYTSQSSIGLPRLRHIRPETLSRLLEERPNANSVSVSAAHPTLILRGHIRTFPFLDLHTLK
jgi:hypothetical protein